jgi:hypothetical protein
MRGLLQAGALVGFVVAAVGMTGDALCLIGVLYLFERVGHIR